ncbi:aminoglycoside phosphotransferase family protein [Ktedonobacter sp. SOSP1-52]|uniref:aminoglycoside phosphotransferase family protein n=1 Tax=Ktedonobacter sp. SOSP1-52 TaxID=2778366 RepID=UPI00191690A7|nr:aminoglycoside phosphotransferase family protein [Ktedonobacter sp. SOSP1-52]
MDTTENGKNIVVPNRVRQRANQSGPQAERWLRELPQLIVDLERHWELRIGRPLSGGSSAYVARAKTADGNDAVVKLGMPNGDFAEEIDTLVRARGQGYVRILQFDYDRRAILLEQLGPSMVDLKLPPERTIILLCTMLKQAWLMPLAAGQTIAAPDYKAQTLAQLITDLWEKLERPCFEGLISQALKFARRRMAAFDPGRCVVAHGDPHPANALQVSTPRVGAESGFVFVDPNGFLCEPEYDLGVVLRDWCSELLAAPDTVVLARKYCRLLADESGFDEASIWEWGFIERVSTGLYISAYGSRELGQPFFETAQRLLDE